MIADFMIRAALAGMGVAVATGVLGCFVVWRRMAYFGDATAHAALLGVALSLAVSANIMGGVLIVAIAVALVISHWSGHERSTDTLLGVMAHGGLALGLVVLALMPGTRVNVEALLFGDILAVDWGDVTMIWLGGGGVVLLLTWRWSALLTATLSPDLAQSEDISTRREDLILTFALAVVVAVAMKVVGALLITAMLIVPAAAARPWVRTPEAMAGLAVLLGVLSVLLGLVAAWFANTPAGPSIVCIATGFFVTTAIFSARHR